MTHSEKHSLSLSAFSPKSGEFVESSANLDNSRSRAGGIRSKAMGRGSESEGWDSGSYHHCRKCGRILSKEFCYPPVCGDEDLVTDDRARPLEPKWYHQSNIISREGLKG